MIIRQNIYCDVGSDLARKGKRLCWKT